MARARHVNVQRRDACGGEGANRLQPGPGTNTIRVLGLPRRGSRCARGLVRGKTADVNPSRGTAVYLSAIARPVTTRPEGRTSL